MAALMLPLSTPSPRLGSFSLISPSSSYPSPMSYTFTLTSSKKARLVSRLYSSVFASYRLHYTDKGVDEDEDDEDEEEDHVIGDCLVFEDGIFDDPYLMQEEEQANIQLKAQIMNPKKKKKALETAPEVEPENLVPDDWRRVVEEINITKKEKRKIAQEFQYGQKLDKKKRDSLPLRVNLEEYLRYRDEKLSQLKPISLDNPVALESRGRGEMSSSADTHNDQEEEEMGNGSGQTRVEPKNPRWAVYGRNLEDISEFFVSGSYQPSDSNANAEGRRKLFTKEEKALLNAKKPDLVAATSGKWLPLHGLVASGEFHLTNTLLKHNVAINDVDNGGLTALHKAIICKKQAITDFLLRESANPFVRDKDGATLMHYAVRTASSNAIKALLLYNVDINLQDNDGWTPLHLAVQGRRTDVVRLLLIKGADKSLKNKDGLTPLELCLYSGQDARTYELIKLLKQLPKPRRSWK